MNKRGEIILVVDDIDDREITREVYSLLDYDNKLTLFKDGEQAYSYLRNTDAHPFLIISDINMPGMNGFELREKVARDSEISKRIIPFIFISTSADLAMIRECCQKSFQGFFEKKNNIQAIKEMLESILIYWKSAIPSF